MQKVLALINARGGSKGIPGKNTKLLAGKPLIGWSIECAKAAKSITRVVVSTDSEEIAIVARQFGAEAPFLRPRELAADDSPQIDTIIHAVEWLEKNEGASCDVVCLLQPTSPFRTPEDVDGALALLEESRSDTVITLAAASHFHPAYLYEMDRDNRAISFIDQKDGLQRQALPPVYIHVGAIYALKREVLAERTLYGKTVRGYVLNREQALNIDEKLDWEIAEFLMDKRLRGS